MSEKHSHTRTPSNFGSAFAVAAVLNIGIVIFEMSYGLATQSTALVADAVHNLADVLGLLLAWGAYLLAKRLPSNKFTYGMGSSTVLASVLNGMLIMAATGAIIVEAVQRFFHPMPVEGGTVMFVAGIAIIFNGISAWILSRGQKNDVNVQSAFWHLFADMLVSVGVLISALLILKTGATWIDPVTSLIVAAVILFNTWSLMKESLQLSLQGVPTSVNLSGVKEYLYTIPGVTRIHDLHVWPISTTETALTVHFVVSSEFDSSTLASIPEKLETFHINHSTIQLEDMHGNPCKLAPEEII